MNVWVTLLIVSFTYLGIALGEFPSFRTNRTTITLMGAGALLAARRNVKLSFWKYTRIGLVITCISLFIGIVWIEVFLWKG